MRVEPGEIIRFDYPAANYRSARLRFEERLLRVREIRDTLAKPLAPMTAVLDPDLARDRYLVQGTDLDRGGERSFYLASMRNIRADDAPQLGTWQVLIVDRAGEHAPELAHSAQSDWEAVGWAERFNAQRTQEDEPLAVVKPPEE